MSPSDFTNITYSVPISFGLIIRKNIDKALSLESGLVYTYLQTRYNNTTANSPNAQLNLHYLGVPLNLIAKVRNNPKWEVYFSVGGMLEKGLWSVYQQHTYFATQVYTTTVETGIVGFQWSTNAAIGTTYKFQKNLGIFFEPKVSYFFNNNQPASARTNQPTELGLVAGLRYEFK
jgi:predicted porin